MTRPREASNRSATDAAILRGGLPVRGALVMLLAATLMSGCLSRTAGPGLPYVEPAVSMPNPNPDPAALQMSSRIQDLEMEMRRLRDMIERLSAHSPQGAEQEIARLQERVSFIERQLGIEPPAAGAEPRPRPPAQPQPPQPLQPAPAPQPAPRVQGDRGMAAAPRPPPPQRETPPPAGRQAATQGLPDSDVPVEIVEAGPSPEEKQYRDAYALLKKGSVDQSAGLFEDFLKRYPKSPLAPDAIYWVGEAKFAAGAYAEAVLQFDRVIKEFPGSRKELNALLKQGQAFEKMSDRRSAKIIYEKLVQEHPHTAQARIASGRLKSIQE